MCLSIMLLGGHTMFATTGLTYRPLFRDLSGSFLALSSWWSSVTPGAQLFFQMVWHAWAQWPIFCCWFWSCAAFVRLLKSVEAEVRGKRWASNRVPAHPKDKTPMKTDFWSKKFRRMGEAARPEVPIAFCMIYFFQGKRRMRWKAPMRTKQGQTALWWWKQGVQGIIETLLLVHFLLFLFSQIIEKWLIVF